MLNYINSSEMKGSEINKVDIAASFQNTVINILVEHSLQAVRECRFDKFAIAGGVTLNSSLCAAFEAECKKEK